MIHGSNFDEYGNYVNWWTEEDKDNFNYLKSQVINYYEDNYQIGDTTLGENIADLGGMKIVLKMAEKNNAQDYDYKEIFEYYAKDMACQNTVVMRYFLLNYDTHSFNENRVNLVLSTINKFYEIYDIKETDGMYVEQSGRVSVW
jgi:putative endopeptidase